MIKYIGSKRALLPAILRAVGSVQGATSVIDLFSGTSRVGHVLKRDGFRVIANDHNAYAHTLAQCYVAADLESVERDALLLLAEFQRLPGIPGYFTETFCEKSRFFQPKNGARIDAIREEIERKCLDPILKSVVLVSLMEASDRVDSTCGLQMAYLKQWAPRASNDLSLRLPDVLPRAIHGRSEAHQLDAVTAVTRLRADVAYIDPPYNQHSYLSNYHIWESLVLWDKPEVYGTACKRMDCRVRKSDFNVRRNFQAALRSVIEVIEAKVLVVSFNNEGYIERGEMEALLSSRGKVHVIAHDYKRYVGAQIGIYNPSGEKVGAVSHLRNLEYLYIVEMPGAQLDLSWVGREPENTSAMLRTSTMPRLQATSSVASKSRTIDAGELFGRTRDLLLGDQRLHVEETQAMPTNPPAAPSPRPATIRGDEGDLPLRLQTLLFDRKRLRSEEAQRILGVEAAQLRPIFRELVERRVASTTGQRRGTIYHWVEVESDVFASGGALEASAAPQLELFSG